jgi:adenine C2-methylase RlmN of 23S rRNA A2503 and tRNA A37
MIRDAIYSAFDKMKARGWTTMYWAIDVHDTILKGHYASDQSYSLYPYAAKVLKWISDQPDMKIIIFTSSYAADYERLSKWFWETHGIKFDYLNENPECGNTDYADFGSKFYFNVLLDDKAGFDPEKDWKTIDLVLRRVKRKCFPTYVGRIPDKILKSADGITEKYIFGKNSIVHVARTSGDATKHIICFPCAEGCKYGCGICHAGANTSGRWRPLKAAEIISMIKTVVDKLEFGAADKLIISAMGTGEPLDGECMNEVLWVMSYWNSKCIERSIPFSLAVSTRVPDICSLYRFRDQVVRRRLRIKLQISLHSFNETTRKSIIGPFNYLLATMYDAAADCQEQFEIEWNYTLIKGVNDVVDVDTAYLPPPGGTLKLNKFNSWPGCGLEGASDEERIRFAGALRWQGVPVEIYDTDGADIMGTCGQTWIGPQPNG